MQHIDEIRRIPNVELRIIKASQLLETVLKRHSPLTEQKLDLEDRIRARREFLGEKLLLDVFFAIGVWNWITHDSDRETPTAAELERAADSLLEATRLHLEEADASSETDRPSVSERLSMSSDPGPEAAQSPPTRSRLSGPPTAARRDLLAETDDPQLTASTLSEFVYCPRAGLIAHEASYAGEEREQPSLGLMHWYEEQALEEAYVRQGGKLLGWGGLLLTWFAFLPHAPLPNPLLYWPLFLVGVYVILKRTVRASLDWLDVARQRHLAKLAVVCEPKPDSDRFQSVNWWGLLRAGFDVERRSTALVHESWKLSGKPRRILRKGSLAIPVIRVRRREPPAQPQHIVRAMAYCHLIEATEGLQSPYAIVLFSGTYDGVTVPNTPGHREAFYAALQQARRVIRRVQAGEPDPPPPTHTGPCTACPHGAPRNVMLLKPTMSNGVQLEPHLLQNQLTWSKRRYHCSCGDRFGWKPHHVRNERLVETQPSKQ